jgi:hypothetical protein
MEIEVIESVTKTIGSLALAYPYLRRLRVAETIDSLTTTGKERRVSTGQVIEVLVLNRLSLRPVPISRLGAWATSQAIEAVYGLVPTVLNDDRIGRALDDLHPHLADAWAAIVLAGAQAYDLQLHQLHTDVTRLTFTGAYDEGPAPTPAGPPLPRITRGYTGRADPLRKQLTVSLTVTADGGLPAWYAVGDGNAADPGVYLPHLTAVRARLGLDEVLVVGDSKLITQANILGFCRVNARFIGPVSLTAADRARLQAAWASGEPMHRLDPPTPGDRPRPGRYWGLEWSEDWLDPEHGTPYALRRLVVQSLDDRRAARHQRAKDLGRARRDLWTIRRRLRYPSYRDPAFVSRKVATAVARVAPYLHAEVLLTADGLDVSWRVDHARLRQDGQYDGVYSLLTNEAADRLPPTGLFAAYKDQATIEGRFRAVKQPPIQVRPVWLHQPRRIESLVFVVMVALFLFALIEREARRTVQASGQVLAGVRAEGRDRLPITTTVLLDLFAPLTLVRQRLRVADAVVEVVTPTSLSPPQAQVLDRLGLAHPSTYLHPTVTSTPLRGAENEPSRGD